MALQISLDRVAVEAADRLAGAKDRPPDRLPCPRRGAEMIEHEVVGGIVDRADLLDDDVLLAFEFFAIEPAVAIDLGQQVEREAAVLLEHMREIAGLLDAGLGVEVAADVLDRLGDLARVARGWCP